MTTKTKSMVRRYLFTVISINMDIWIYVFAYLFALSVRSLSVSLIIDMNIPFIALSTAILIIAFIFSGIYQRIWSQTSGDDASYILRATCVVFVVTAIINLMSSPRPVPVSVLITYHIIALGGFITVRYRRSLIGAFRWRYRAVRFKEFPDYERVLVVGAGNSGQHTVRRLRKNTDPQYNYKVVGFLDDNIDKIGMKIENSEILGPTDAVGEIVSEHKVDLIAFAIHNISGPEFRRILELCQATNARIKIVPDPFKLFGQKAGAPNLRDVTPEDLIGRSIITKHKDVDLSPIMNRVVMVTGAAGSIGSEIARQILDYNPVRLDSRR